MEEKLENAKKLAKEMIGGYWNTRIIRKYIDGKYQDGEEYHEVYMGMYEVYYKGDGTILGWTEEPMRIIFEDREELGAIIGQLIEATEKPILELKDDKIIETNEVLVGKGR